MAVYSLDEKWFLRRMNERVPILPAYEIPIFGENGIVYEQTESLDAFLSQEVRVVNEQKPKDV